MALKSLFSRKTPLPPPRTIAAGERLYAIGDIHGRRDCLDELLLRIGEDDRERGPANTTLVLLGDLVDRGPESRGVIERLTQLSKARPCIFLMGNHEEVFIDAWEGDEAAARLFHRIGGRETLLSYGVSAADYDSADFTLLVTLLATHVPADHIAFLRGFRDTWRSGDYLFVHAGIKPGTPIEEQRPADMRWIRDRFLDDPRDHGVIVVHGHSITAGIDERPNRIGIDTGAYASGRLTAIGLEGSERWFLST
ncbi:metallophosphoesterase family protein [Sphingomonas sp. SUN039]|uniref:metallophosphoesterase family protein n=1 Tax=Sphingomonas sp. SUN039 TaxID=2937787 RepID=UPI0021644B4C|nr:metallophosphoesterase family protein [Sphingomonas sp. SUN039]UVO52872.1 serine/threonine protein phosphatase [Sphingomonas sp. SUN039]